MKFYLDLIGEAVLFLIALACFSAIMFGLAKGGGALLSLFERLLPYHGVFRTQVRRWGAYLSVLLLGCSGWFWLDSAGLMPHRREAYVTAQSNWFVGESKYCNTFPLKNAEDSKDVGYAFSRVSCDDGAEHDVRITFWGREHQTEYDSVQWKCTREEGGFTCAERSGLRVGK